MTQVQTFTRDLSAAATASRSRLDAVLDATRVTLTEYVALNLLGQDGPHDEGAFRETLRQALRTDLGIELERQRLDELLSRLGSAGLLRHLAHGTDGAPSLELTGEGRALQAQIRTVMSESLAEFTAGLDPKDLETAHRVLHELGMRGQP
jgi:DNA-binding MarR family transcriptional regulator